MLTPRRPLPSWMALAGLAVVGMVLSAAPELWAAEPLAQTPSVPASPNPLTVEEQTAGWRLLFDGRTTKGWRVFRADTSRRGPWAVEDGCLKRPAAGIGDAQGGSDLVTEDTFSDFDLRWEWRVGRGGNSGVKYFVTEERSRPIAHEYQMLDDVAYPDEAKGTQQTAAFYDVLPPSPDKHLRPTGEWNQSRILVRGDHVEHWLNGQKVLEYELGSPQVLAGIARSKFKDVPGFGTKIKGHILLQDHEGGGVCFRNIKILSPPRQERRNERRRPPEVR